MAIQIQKRTSLHRSTESRSLANQAKKQMYEFGQVDVRCPKCKTIPKVIIQGKYQERVFVRCQYGYIIDGELGI